MTCLPVEPDHAPTRSCAGGCGKTVGRGRGRAPGKPWYCRDPECLRVRDRGHATAARRRAGVRERTPGTCRHCGGPYRGSLGRGEITTGLCNQPDCLTLKRRLRAKAQQQGYARLAHEFRPRWLAILAEETEAVFAETVTPVVGGVLADTATPARD